MSDNFPLTPGSGRNAATDQVTYSGDTADVQLMRPVLVTGAEGGKTVVDLPGDATYGIDVDVTRLPSIPAGSNNIGDVDVLSIAAGDNNIGNVDIVTVPTDPFGRNADAAALTGTMSAKLGSIAVSCNEMVSTGVLISPHTNQNGWVNIRDGADVNELAIDANGQAKVILPTNTVGGAASLPAGTNNIGDVDILSIAAGDNNIGNVDIVTVPADPFGANADAASASGSISAKLREIATNGVILKAGTAAIGKLAANDGVDIGNVDVASLPASTNTIEVVGDVAHSAAVAGNPLQICGASQDCDDTAPPNRVDAEGDATRLATDRDGSLFVRPHGPQTWSYHFDGSTAQTDTQVHAAPGSGLSLYVGSIVFSSGAATAINLFFEEGSTKVLGPYYLEAVAGRGFAIQFNPPKKITANTALTFTTSASIAHSLDVTGFVAQG